MFRYCTGLVSFCGLYVLQKCRVSISFVRIDVFGTNQVFFLCAKPLRQKFTMCSFVCNIVYGSFACVCDRQFALRKNNGSISAVTQRAAVANSSVSFGVFRWRCVLFEKLKFCRWFAVGLPLGTKPAFGVCRVGCDVNFGTRIFICRNR